MRSACTYHTVPPWILPRVPAAPFAAFYVLIGWFLPLGLRSGTCHFRVPAVTTGFNVRMPARAAYLRLPACSSPATGFPSAVPDIDCSC